MKILVINTIYIPMSSPSPETIDMGVSPPFIVHLMAAPLELNNINSCHKNWEINRFISYWDLKEQTKNFINTFLMCFWNCSELVCKCKSSSDSFSTWLINKQGWQNLYKGSSTSQTNNLQTKRRLTTHSMFNNI